MRKSLWPLAAIVLISCYSPKIPNGTQLCSSGGACPSGYQCAVDDRCYLIGQGPPATPVDLAMSPDLSVAEDLAMCSQSSCAAPTPICDPDSNQCVPCLQDSQCGTGQICQMKRCVAGCSMVKRCADGGGVCDVDAGMCKTCKMDSDCPDPMNSRCELSTGQCVACQPTNDNCVGKSACVEMAGVWQCSMVACKVNADCGSPGDGGQNTKTTCCNSICVDVTADSGNCGQCGNACANNGTCCASACTDITTDVANCGACGVGCSGKNATWSCTNSACAINSCSGTFRDCNMNPSDGCEANIISDPNNCLRCGKVCAVPNAVAACVQACSVGMCNPGFADCNKNVLDGCEANIASDVNNCGACGKSCGAAKNGTAACAMGVCAIGSCNPGFADCDGVFANGCEVTTANDPNNCGKCATKCPSAANDVSTCVNGACGPETCVAPFKDCNQNPNDGCEVNSSTDSSNCGACGKVCGGIPNGTAACKAGVCGIGSCAMGFADCGNLGNTCETNLQTDINNCGKCQMVCPAGGNGTAACKSGTCSLTCPQGFLDCDLNANNGCEVNSQTDSNNCGACAMKCANGQTCVASVCTAMMACNPACLPGTNCIANNLCQTPNHAAGTFGPTHTFAGASSTFFISTGQGGCSVNNGQNAAIDAAYFCTHFYGPNCAVQNGFQQASMSGNKMHKNSGCTSSGSDIPSTVCDTNNAPGMACKMWIASGEVDAGLTNLVCVCM